MDAERAMSQAEEASEVAYAPYSGFRVGAAVVTEEGETFTGCNVENASYGLTVCAERNAVAAMVLSGGSDSDGAGRRIRYVSVASPDAAPAFPCGACRQVLHEFGCTRVFVRETDGIKGYDFGEILPNAFGPEAL